MGAIISNCRLGGVDNIAEFRGTAYIRELNLAVTIKGVQMSNSLRNTNRGLVKAQTELRQMSMESTMLRYSL